MLNDLRSFTAHRALMPLELGLSMGLTLGAGASGPPAYVVVNAEAAAVIARMTGTTSDADKETIDGIVGRLKVGAINGSNVWAKLDVFRWEAAHSFQAACLNWISTSFTASMTGTEGTNWIFVPNAGIWVDGSAGKIDWNWAPTDGVNYTQNSAHLAAGFRKPSADGTSLPDVGTASGTSYVHINPRGSTDNATYRINCGTSVTAIASVSSAYGWHVANRVAASGTNAIGMYKTGALLGTTSTTASTTLTTNGTGGIASGCVAGSFQSNQFFAASAGAGLTANEQADFNAAIAYGLTRKGLSEIVVTAPATLSLGSGVTLPDGASAVAGKGFPNTDITKDPIDGKWWCGHGRGIPTVLLSGIVRLNADLTTPTIDAEYQAVADWGQASGGSMQGVAFDTSDNTLWSILKVTASGTYLLHFSRAGALLSSTLVGADWNGLAYDSLRDQLVVANQGAINRVQWYAKTDLTTVVRSFALTCDQLSYYAPTDEILASIDGSPGSVRHYPASYGGAVVAKNYTLTSADCIEGVHFDGTSYRVMNDGYTHSGSPALNRLLTYTP